MSRTAVPGGRIHEVLQLGEVLTRVPGAAYVQTRARNCWGSRRWTVSLPCRPSDLWGSSALVEVVFVSLSRKFLSLFLEFLNDYNVECSLKVAKAVETSCALRVGGFMAEPRI